jgi:hypothetical protein
MKTASMQFSFGGCGESVVSPQPLEMLCISLLSLSVRRLRRQRLALRRDILSRYSISR